MKIRIDLLNREDEDQYKELEVSSTQNLLYHSLKYRDFLRNILRDSKEFYLVAYNSGRMVGALPCFLKKSKHYGNVLNSLPFFGSNGGIICLPHIQEKTEVKNTLLGEFRKLEKENSAISSTIISNPLFPDKYFYEQKIEYTFMDYRNGQLIEFPKNTGGKDRLEDTLMSMFHQKTRNMVRKAKKSGIKVLHDDSIEALRILAHLHRHNMEAIGGTVKPWHIFKAMSEVFSYESDYKLYLAYKDEIPIAALLVFFFNRTVEYFVPALRSEYRALQPNSLLILEAMKESCRRGFRYWNWGGTWASQKGVYHFKKRWGTEDKRYYYYTRILNKKILNLKKEQLLDEFKYFYVLPFSELKTGKY